MKNKFELIKLLADGKFHSGVELGQQLQMTRSSVWNLIQQLSPLGIDLYCVKGKGYQIPGGLNLLDQKEILQLLSAKHLSITNLELLAEVNSTNQFILDNHARLKSGSAVLAEHQTQGRGRRQKPWFSPFGSNIYLSMLWSFDKDPVELAGLSLAAGVAMANALKKFGLPKVKLKWPNDVLINYQKIAGVLIELTAETHSMTHVVIGIGVNVRMPSQTPLTNNWSDIVRETCLKPNRNLLAAYLIEETIDMLLTFQQKGFAPFYKLWQTLDAFYNQPVEVLTPTKKYLGIAKGINQQGELLLLEEQQERRFLHGEISLRLNNKLIPDSSSHL